ncbi:MAG: hypothetical protein ACLFM6_09535 [Spirochaetaceae bacterium]
MERILVEQPWLGRVMPEGFPTHTSTLITGPGGSGKPLIGNLIAATWLRQGGSVVFMSLQYPSHQFIVSALKELAALDLYDYPGRAAFIELDATTPGIVPVKTGRLKANLVLPDIWDEAIDRACSMVPDEGPGILVYGSALNLLLFSPTYGQTLLDRMRATIESDKRRTYLFSVSTTAKGEMIAELEAVADNLITSRSERKPFRLYMRVLRMRNTDTPSSEIEVPFASDELENMKEIADHSRLRVIPLISKI